MFEPAPMVIDSQSPRSTAWYQVLAPAPSVTSPSTTDVGATNAAGSISGFFPRISAISASAGAPPAAATSSVMPTILTAGRLVSHRTVYGGLVPKNENVFSSATAAAAAWRRRAASRLVHRGWQWVQQAGAVTAARPGPLRFGRIGEGTRLAFPLGTVFGEEWIHLGD